MRTTVLALLILLGSLPAAHADRDYPWCVVGDDLGWPGECMYETREQCMKRLGSDSASRLEKALLDLKCSQRPAS